MPGPEGEEDRLIRQIATMVCPWCGFEGELERSNQYWVCPSCNRRWEGLNSNDRRFLRSIRVKSDA